MSKPTDNTEQLDRIEKGLARVLATEQELAEISMKQSKLLRDLAQLVFDVAEGERPARPTHDVPPHRPGGSPCRLRLVGPDE